MAASTVGKSYFVPLKWLYFRTLICMKLCKELLQLLSTGSIDKREAVPVSKATFFCNLLA